MAKAKNANSAIHSAVAALAAVPVGAPIDTAVVATTDTPVDTAVVAATDTPVDTAVVAATDTPVDTAVVAATDTPVDTALDPVTDTSVDTALDPAVSAPVVPVKVRVLAHCGYGKPDDVIQLDPALVKTLDGVVDSSPAAVAYAQSLVQ
jgi:hypothetical protein